MGVAFHELKFLMMIAKKRELADVLTFARQDLNVSKADIAKEYGPDMVLDDYKYAEELLKKKMGASSVSSIDNSDYEGANYIENLNNDIKLEKRFDTVLDFGTSEHIFNIGQSFKNAIKLCKIGGRIVHSLPANSECGHGFYQVSPELFFALYSERNGFRNTIVYVADLMNESSWYAVTAPSGGQRAMANSLSATYILCVTEKFSDTKSISVQQSDYVQAWKEGYSVRRGQSAIKDRMRKMFKGSVFAGTATLIYRSMFAGTGLHRANVHLKKVSIASQIERYH